MSSKSAVDKAQEAIRELILTGKYPSGARLKEEELAAITGASRTPVREALLRLQAEGLVEFSPNRGAVVASLRGDDLESIFELRALLEGFGSHLAARKATAEHVAELTELAEQMEEAFSLNTTEDLDRAVLLNNRFHRRILEIGGNRRLADLQRALVQLPLVLRTFHEYTPRERARSMAHHREIIDAIASHDDAWAQAIMRTHVLSARPVARRGVEHDADG